MSAVLVTGGAGYIGSHVCKALAELRADAGLLRHAGEGPRWAVRWGPLERGDIGDGERLDEVFARHRPRAIVHLAGYIEVGELVREPERYMHNNATKTAALIEAALRHGIEAFVFSSTCAVYGLPQSDLLDENAPHRADQPLCRVQGAGRGRARGGSRAACARPRCAISTPPAPTPAARSARRTQPETHLLPLAVDAALGLAPPLTLLGTDYPTPDGSCVRDFVHVTDLADAHVRALRLAQEAAGRACTRPSTSAAARATACARRSPRPRASPAVRCRTGRAAPARRFAPAGRRHRQVEPRARLAAEARPRASRSRTRCAGAGRCRAKLMDRGPPGPLVTHEADLEVRGR